MWLQMRLTPPTVGMTQVPMVAQLHSPIINMNISMGTSYFDKEEDKALVIQQTPATVEDYIQVYHQQASAHTI